MSSTTFVEAYIGKDNKAVAARRVETAADKKMNLTPDQLTKHLLRLEPNEFAKQIAILTKEVEQIKRLALQVGKKGEAKFNDGRKVTSKDLTELVARHNKKMRSLKQNYIARGSKKRRSNTKKDGTPRKQGNSLERATFIDDNLANFWASTNLGARNAEVQALIKPALDRRYISRAIMAPLLGMYSKVNSYTVEETGSDGKTKKKTYIKADPAMRQFLGPYLQQSGVDPEKFVYSSLQKIINPGTFKKAQLDEQRLALTEDKATTDALKAIRLQLTAINNAL